MSNIIIPGEEIKVLDAKAYGSTLAMDLGEHNFEKDEEIQVDTLRARVTGKIFFVDKNVVKMKITKIEEKEIIH